MSSKQSLPDRDDQEKVPNPAIAAILCEVDLATLRDHWKCGMGVYRKNGEPLTDAETLLIDAVTWDDFETIAGLLEVEIRMGKESLEQNLRIRQLDVAISLKRAEIRALKERLRAIDEEAK